MEIRLIIFDLDGVLVKTKEMHFVSLNKALSDVAGRDFVITESEHVSKYDGLKTTDKLDKLTREKGLPPSMHEAVWRAKQDYTAAEFGMIAEDPEIVSTMRALKEDGYIIACCSNSIARTVQQALSRLGTSEFFDLVLSNEDVTNAKPDPEIFLRAMSHFKVPPLQTLIVEDSPNGLLAAHRSGAFLHRVEDPGELTIDKIRERLSEINSNPTASHPRWVDGKLNIVIPMAGAGSRFEKAGHCLPKPLIDVGGNPMIKVVVENLNIDANYIFIVLKSHNEKYNLSTMLALVAPGCKVIEVDGLTEGAACTVLTARDMINNDSPLLLANSDQFIEWNSNEFMYKMSTTEVDGGIVTFKASHPKWSFAKIDPSTGFVAEVAEKNPISDDATVGVYYWKRGSDFVRYTDDMISKDIRVNNEFYVCPVFNEAIADNKKIVTFPVERMWGLGTPEDLQYFNENYGRV
jgi:HAD superfamily hydrolase (TIGR01509 family)